MNSVDIIIYEPTQQYQNVAKWTGVKKLALDWSLVVELIKRYWILGMECSLLVIQKLMCFLNQAIDKKALPNEFNLHFKVHNYGSFWNK